MGAPLGLALSKSSRTSTIDRAQQPSAIHTTPRIKHSGSETFFHLQMLADANRNREALTLVMRLLDGSRTPETGPLSILLLEKSTQFIDRIRGESIASWGVVEARQIGVLDLLVAAGAVYIRRNVPYGEGVPPEVAQAHAIAVDEQAAGSQGNLDIGHPLMCQTLTRAAVSAGANLLRGASEVRVSHGMRPTITFVHEGRRHEIKPRLIIGADGRGSAVANQIGAIVQSDPVHHLMGGLLVERFPDWPIEDMTIGTEGDVTFYVFPAREHIRLYLCYSVENRRRFAGPDAAKNFLNAFHLRCLPQGESFANARPVGPCQGYPNADTWIDEPMKPGVVLIGDAAGHNDPAIGQGVSIAWRDVRLVADALTSSQLDAGDVCGVCP